MLVDEGQRFGQLAAVLVLAAAVVQPDGLGGLAGTGQVQQLQVGVVATRHQPELVGIAARASGGRTPRGRRAPSPRPPNHPGRGTSCQRRPRLSSSRRPLPRVAPTWPPEELLPKLACHHLRPSRSGMTGCVGSAIGPPTWNSVRELSILSGRTTIAPSVAGPRQGESASVAQHTAPCASQGHSLLKARPAASTKGPLPLPLPPRSGRPLLLGGLVFGRLLSDRLTATGEEGCHSRSPSFSTETTMGALGMVTPKEVKSTGSVPTTTTASPTRWAVSSSVTSWLTSRMVRLPGTDAVKGSSAGTAPRSTGSLETNEAVGNSSVPRARWMASSRRGRSLTMAGQVGLDDDALDDRARCLATGR